MPKLWYLLVFVLSFSSLFLFANDKQLPLIRAFSYSSVFAVLAFIPALQYNIGTDYFSYKSFYETPAADYYFIDKGEVFIVWVMRFLRAAGLEAQWLFVVYSLLMTACFVLLLKVLRRDGYNVAIVFFCFFLITNIYHNQMNGLRAYLAVFLFLLALAYRFEGRFFLALAILVFGFFSHNSILYFSLLIIVPPRVWEKLCEHKVKVFVASNVFFFLVLKIIPIEKIISSYFPIYISYMGGEYLEPAGFLSVLTKLYYFPGFLFFFLYVRDSCIVGSGRNYVGMWAAFSGFFWLLLESGAAFRLYNYLVFLSIFPFYFIIVNGLRKKDVVTLVVLSVYLLVPYVYKVVYASHNEFGFSLITF